MIEIPKVQSWTDTQANEFKSLVTALAPQDGMPDVNRDARSLLEEKIVEYNDWQNRVIKEFITKQLSDELARRIDDDILQSLKKELKYFIETIK